MLARITDYDKMWSEQMKAFDHSSDTANYWDRRSRAFNSIWRTSTYAGDLMSRMELSAEYSVLDVACGTGVMAIPLSREVSRVTALDISPQMLKKLRQRITLAGITNISIINKDWNTVVVAKDIAEHDIVLVSRSLPDIRLSETLRRIDRAARSTCYITWRAERRDEYEKALSEAMDKQQRPYPDYRLISGVLESMGIAIKVEIFESHNKEKYPNLEEAVKNMARGAEISDRQFSKLWNIAKNRLTLVDGFYTAAYTMKWALISWNKST